MGFESKIFFLQFLVDIFSLVSEFVDPHIFADPDPDPGSQNLADPDPKHCSFLIKMLSFFFVFKKNFKGEDAEHIP